MKSFFAAIGAALRAAFRMLARLANMPGRALRGLLGFAPDDDYVPARAPFDDVDDEPGHERSRHEIYGEASSRVLLWAAESLIDDRPAPVPAELPQEIKWWLPCLSHEECEAIINAERGEISLHLQGIRTLAGVRPVQALDPAPWPASPGMERADAVVPFSPAEPEAAEHAPLAARP